MSSDTVDPGGPGRGEFSGQPRGARGVPTRVLVVDPSPVAASLTRSSLEALGYEVAVCSSRREAVTRLQVDSIDVVLTALELAGESGLELVRALETLALTIPVLVLTTTADPGLKSKILESGGRDLVPKNAPLDLFRQRIEHALEEPGDRKARILAVDDDPLVLKLLRRVLSDKGFEVSTAESALVAWQTLHLRRFDLVVSDFTMREHSGLELLENMRKQHLSIPFILLAARISDDQLTMARALGAADVLVKSGEMEPLLAAIGLVLGEKRVARGG